MTLLARSQRIWPVVATVGWLVAVSAGMAVVFAYSGRPAAAATPAATWPPEVTLARAPTKPTLVMLVHPHCPCTRASLSELAQIVTVASNTATIHVLFMQPAGVDDDWVHSDTYARASALPGVLVTPDPGGRIAARLGARASGHVVVYDEHGSLQFSGGITGARGHEGDNLGLQRAIAALRHRHDDGPSTTKTYGCSLVDGTAAR